MCCRIYVCKCRLEFWPIKPYCNPLCISCCFRFCTPHVFHLYYSSSTTLDIFFGCCILNIFCVVAVAVVSVVDTTVVVDEFALFALKHNNNSGKYQSSSPVIGTWLSRKKFTQTQSSKYNTKLTQAVKLCLFCLITNKREEAPTTMANAQRASRERVHQWHASLMLFSHKKCQSALPLYLCPWMYVQQLFANKRNHVMILSLWFVIVVGRFVGWCCFFNYLELHVGRFVFFFCSTVSSFFREFLNVLFAYLSLSLW